MNCKFEVVLVLVPECLPQKWDVLALVYQEGPGMIDILSRPVSINAPGID